MNTAAILQGMPQPQPRPGPQPRHQPRPQPRPWKLIRALEQIFDRGIAFGKSLMATLNAAPEPATPAEENAQNRTFIRAQRALRASIWAIKLEFILRGLSRCTYKPRPNPAKPDPKPHTRAPRPRSHPNVDYNLTYFMRRLATQPLGAVIASLCRDLGIKYKSEHWPAEFISITITAVEAASLPDDAPALNPKPIYEKSQQESPFLKERTKELLPIPDTS